MPTTRTTRTQRSAGAQPGRFGRSGAGRSTSRPAVRGSASPQQRRRAVGIRRRPPQQSGMQKALGAVSGAVPGLGGKKRSSSGTRGKGGKAGGVALLTAAAGLAFQNRDKVTSMLRRKRSDESTTAPVTSGTPTNSPTVQPHS